MVTFIKKMNSCEYLAKIDGITRFFVVERCDYAGGWNLFTINNLLIERFETLCEVETYIEAMDN